MAAFEIRKLEILWKINLDLAVRIQNNFAYSRSQWPLAGWDRGLESRRGHGCLLYCVFSGRGLCVGLITRPVESYRVWCVQGW